MQNSFFYTWLDISVPAPQDNDLEQYTPQLIALQENLISTPRQVEVFGTRMARDRAVGPIDEHYSFIPISADMLSVVKHAGYELTIGNQLGDPLFGVVAASVLPKVRQLIRIGRASSVVIARVRYHWTEEGWCGEPVWPNAVPPAFVSVETEQWLDRVMQGLSRRVPDSDEHTS